METSTYDDIDLASNNSIEIYSTIPTKVNPSYEVLRITNFNKSEVTEVEQNDLKCAPYKTKLIVVLIIMMVILLLITIVSIVLSIATYSHLTSK